MDDRRVCMKCRRIGDRFAVEHRQDTAWRRCGTNANRCQMNRFSVRRLALISADCEMKRSNYRFIATGFRFDCQIP